MQTPSQAGAIPGKETMNLYSIFIVYLVVLIFMIPSTITHIEYSPSREVTFIRCKPSKYFAFKEGQFMMVRSNHICPSLKKHLKKPYSIATTHQEFQDYGTIGFVVKKTVEGFMSEHLTEIIQLGDTIHLTGPAGHLIDTHAHENYLLISIGSGLSPMIGLYESISAQQKSTGKICMLYGERYAHHILHSTIDLLSKKGENRKHMLFLSKEETPMEAIKGTFGQNIYSDNFTIQRGHIQNGLRDALDFLCDTGGYRSPPGDNKNISVFLCGKAAMVDEVKAIIMDYGIAKENIKSEKY